MLLGRPANSTYFMQPNPNPNPNPIPNPNPNQERMLLGQPANSTYFMQHLLPYHPLTLFLTARYFLTRSACCRAGLPTAP